MVSSANPRVLAAITPTAILVRRVEPYLNTTAVNIASPIIHPRIGPRLTVVIRLNVNEPVMKTSAASQYRPPPADARWNR